MRFRDFSSRAGVIIAMAGLVFGLTHLFSESKTPSIAAHETADAPSMKGGTKFSAMAGASSGEINYAPGYSALDPLTQLNNAQGETLFDPQDNYWGLPRSAGYEEVAAYCTACHSLRIVMQQRQPREGWNYLLTWMTEKQGMAPPPTADREILLDYLSQHFGEPN